MKPLIQAFFPKSLRGSLLIARKDVSHDNTSECADNKRHLKYRKLQLVPRTDSAKVLELLQPGSFVTLENHPNDLPPFQLLQCKGGRCWVRQQAWGQHVHWEVEHRRLKSA